MRDYIRKGIKMRKGIISQFVKTKRKSVGLTQEELAKKAGVGLRLIRDLEQGRRSPRLDKANQILQLFGYEVGPVKKADTNTVFDKENGEAE